jgi:Xaa-Pro dipeptidase
MFLGIDGQLTHLARPADLGNAAYSSICEDIRIAVDSQDAPRSGQIREMLDSLGMQGKRIGIQVDTMGLTPRLFLEIQAELDSWCELIVAPDFIRELRLVKSPQELGYLRRAGEIMDKVMKQTIEATFPGAYEGDIYATFYDSLFRMGADLPAHIPPLGSGKSALNLRYTSGRKHVLNNDQVTLELGVAYRHYHAASMCVVLTGPDISERHLKMHETSVIALEAVQSILRPGTTVGAIYDTYRETLEDNGEHDAVLTVCGYTMGYLSADLDGAAVDIRGQSAGARGKHVVFHAHDPERPQLWPLDGGGGASHYHQRCTGDHHACAAHANHQELTLAPR